MFADTSRLAVTKDGQIDHKDITPEMDVMFIRKKMDFGTRQKVISAAIKISGSKEDDATQVDVGAYQLALMQHNILAWQGPSFANVACTKKAIESLDPDEPLVQKVMELIGAANQNALGNSDPKSTTAGVANGEATA